LAGSDSALSSSHLGSNVGLNGSTIHLEHNIFSTISPIANFSTVSPNTYHSSQRASYVSNSSLEGMQKIETINTKNLPSPESNSQHFTHKLKTISEVQTTMPTMLHVQSLTQLHMCDTYV
jgi:hypothetical protein